MIRGSMLAGAVALAITGTHVAAAAPIVSGTYALSATSFCQAKATVGINSAVISATIGTVACPGNTTCPAVVAAATGSTVRTFTTQSSGNFSQTIGTAAFNNTTKKVILKQTEVAGDVTIHVMGVDTGTKMTRKVYPAQTLTYSYTSTQVTVTGLGTFDAVFSNIVSNTVGRIDVLQRQVKPDTTCVFRGTFIKQ